MMHYYYSAYSKEYAHKGLVLYNSMKRHDRDFIFFLIYLDEETKSLLEKMQLEKMILINVKSIETYDGEMLKVKSWHQAKSYTWLVKAIGALYIFEYYTEPDHLLWLDGDTQFLADPQAIYDEWSSYSVLLSEEKFTDEYSIYSELYGYYNTGLLGFKRDDNSLECLSYYRKKLLACNFDDYKGSWNDQLYATDWPQRFSNVGVVINAGINLTPFITYYRSNIEKGWLVNRKGDEYFLQDNKIVLYHFMALKYINGNEYDLCNYVMDFNDETIKHLYMQYLKECTGAMEQMGAINGSISQPAVTTGRLIRNYFNMAANINEPVLNICTMVSAGSLVECIALHSSLSFCSKGFRLWICCADDKSNDILNVMKLDNTVIIDIKNYIYMLERTDAESHTCADDPSLQKYALIYYILKNNYNIEYLLYAENDFFPYSIPEIEFQGYLSTSDIFEDAAKGKFYEICSCCNSKLTLFERTEDTLKWLSSTIAERKQQDGNNRLPAASNH